MTTIEKTLEVEGGLTADHMIIHAATEATDFSIPEWYHDITTEYPGNPDSHDWWRYEEMMGKYSSIAATFLLSAGWEIIHTENNQRNMDFINPEWE